MKDYLSKDERVQLLFLKKYMDNINRILEEWGIRNNLSKEEVKSLKSARTWGEKAFDSIKRRLNPTAEKTFWNSIKDAYIRVHDEYAMKRYSKHLSSKLNDEYEKNRDYYRLVELILDKNCKNCQMHCTGCEIYKEFEEHCIPEPLGYDSGKCRYAYTDEMLKEAETVEKLRKFDNKKLEEIKKKVNERRAKKVG